MILDWKHPNGYLGIFETIYKDHHLRIHPVGSSEWDGFIDEELVYGTDDLESVEIALINMVDRTELAGLT